MDGEGKVTERRISDIAPEGSSAIIAFCHLRQEMRTFIIKRILFAAYPDTGEIVEDLYKCFGLPAPEDNKKSTIIINPSFISKIPGHSSEAYKGQRNKEKYKLFKRFQYPVIINLYKNKLFALFNYKYYKCEQTGDLDIDHHRLCIKNVQYNL